MNDLITWLRAQLDEDEARIAEHPDGEDDWMMADSLVAEAEQNYPCSPYLRISKKRALAEVDAKRQIIDLHERTEFGDFTRRTALEDALRLAAVPLAGRPGYREEWRPA